MDEALDEALIKDHKPAWQGGDLPYKVSYGKLMMWFFLITDTLTFSAFLTVYGFNRFTYPDTWPIAEEVFTHFPALEGDHPLLFVALMTFILIMSSVTMVLAVNYGHKMQKKKVILWLSLTIIGGAMFLGSQAWEWGHFIHGDKGAIQHTSGDVYHIAKQKPVLNSLCVVEGDVVEHTKADRSCCFELASIYTLMGVDGHDGTHHDFTVEEVEKFLRDNVEYGVRKPDKTYVDHEASLVYFEEDSLYAKNPGISPGIPFDKVLLGANLKNNEYGPPLFANCFFFITGFHGFHVFSGVLFLIIILINVIKGTYEKRGHYEMVEKVGLYWHFVDLVWVFVFTVFYLIISSKII